MNNLDDLIILPSGTVATDEVARDAVHAEEIGSQAKAQFITRLESGTDTFEPIKQLNLKTLDDMSKKIKVTNSQQKVVQFKQQGNVAFSLFLKSQSLGLKIDLEELMSYYPLTSVPYSISTPDGALAKTVKSKSMHLLLKEVPLTFGQISSKLFDMMPVDCDSVFSTDIYYQYSVKSTERSRRCVGPKLII